MDLVQAFSEKLKLLDSDILKHLKTLGEEYDRAYPAAQTPDTFNLAVKTFLRQRMAGASPETQALVRFYIAFSRFNTIPPMERGVRGSQRQAINNMSPGARDRYNSLLKDDPQQARAFLVQEMMASLKLMGEILSNVSKTRSEISQTFARNARA